MVAGFALLADRPRRPRLEVLAEEERLSGRLFSFAAREWKGAANWSFAGPGGGVAARSSRRPLRLGRQSRLRCWRAGELARLEEECRKLFAAEREFAEFLEQLRRARDREEFDRFMQERRWRQGTTSD